MYLFFLYLQAAFGINLVIKGVYGNKIPGSDAARVCAWDKAVAKVMVERPEGHDAFITAHCSRCAVDHLHVVITA